MNDEEIPHWFSMNGADFMRKLQMEWTPEDKQELALAKGAFHVCSFLFHYDENGMVQAAPKLEGFNIAQLVVIYMDIITGTSAMVTNETDYYAVFPVPDSMAHLFGHEPKLAVAVVAEWDQANTLRNPRMMTPENMREMMEGNT